MKLFRRIAVNCCMVFIGVFFYIGLVLVNIFTQPFKVLIQMFGSPAEVASKMLTKEEADYEYQIGKIDAEFRRDIYAHHDAKTIRKANKFLQLSTRSI